ncbi:MAG: nitroreductase [Clostridiales bacterium]|jgi:nitroreductase|nr:nitroreductase [Clostridiales bacterium]
MPIDTLETIRTRYSCRAFTDKLPSDQDLQVIAQAGVCAPSGMNRQPWQIIVLKNKELIHELEEEGMKNLEALPDQSIYERIRSRGGRLYYNAPCMMLIPIVEDAFLDCGIVTENIALAATSLGIDTLICGLAKFSFAGAQGKILKEKLHFPAGYDLGIAVLLGYAENPGGTPHIPDMDKILWID